MSEFWSDVDGRNRLWPILRLLLVPLVLVVAAIGWNLLRSDEQEPAATVPGGVPLSDVRVGDCLVLPEEDTSGTPRVTNVKRVPCTGPHAAEVFGEGELSDAGYPGEANVLAFADRTCSARFQPFVGRSLDTSRLRMSWVYPTAQSWSEGSRRVLCLVADPDQPAITRSLRQSRR